MSLPIGDMGEQKPEEGSRAASLAAILKGFLPKLSLEDFLVEPEKACQKLLVTVIMAEAKAGSKCFGAGSPKDWNRS